MANAPRLIFDLTGELDRLGSQPRKAPVEVQLPAETVGQELCKARQDSGRQLSDVWLVLKIRPDQLIAIEEGRFEALPGRVYAIGYVRSYAAYLGLDSDRLVERLKTELDGPATLDGPGAVAVSALDLLPALTERVMRLPLRLPDFLQSRTVITALLLLAFIYSGYYALSSGRAVEPPVTPVPARLLAEAGVAQKTLADVPRVPIEQGVPIERVSVQQAPVTPPSETLPPVPTEVAVTPASLAIPVELMPKIRAAELPAGKRYGTRNRNSRITLRVHRPTYVAIQGARNRKFLDRALFPGDTYRVPNMVGLRLSSPDAGAVELILDGSSMGFVGQDGAPAKALSLNPQNIVDRQPRG